MSGNKKLLERPNKVAFLSSRKISASVVLKCYDWATAIRETDQCIISGFQSPLEKDVLKFLLRGKAPIILVLARKLWETVPNELHDAMDAGRLLIVSSVSCNRASIASAAIRNHWIPANSSSLVIGSLDPNGHLAKLVSTFPTEQIIRLDIH
ncbi:MAG: hypothetical protein IKS92_04020 [Victivallales bacterium]|nr:hypothetical protein [Victivallales bacterium]